MNNNVVIADKFNRVGVNCSLLISVGNSPVGVGKGIELFCCRHSILLISGNSFGVSSLFFAEERVHCAS